jgi:hypothetical protein
VLGCNWPYLAVVKHVDKLIELNIVTTVIITIHHEHHQVRRHLLVCVMLEAREGKH